MLPAGLQPQEEAYLKAWVWESVHLRRDGRAHQLAEGNGIDGKEVVHLVEASFPLLRVDDLVFADEQPPFDRWPWPGRSLTEICADLTNRSRAGALP